MSAADSKVFLVVHLYEDGLKVCRRVDAAFEALAKEHVHVDFIRLCKNDTPSGLPCSAIPSSSFTVEENLSATMMKVADKIGDKCSRTI